MSRTTASGETENVLPPGQKRCTHADNIDANAIPAVESLSVKITAINRRDSAFEKNEFSALNTLIQDRSKRWSNKARAIKFDIEFKSVEQERKRVAKEIHDEILPQLARLIRSIQSSELDNAVTALVEELHITVSAFRDLLADLHPVDLEELGLIASLQNICKRQARLHQRSINFVQQAEECNLSSIQQLYLYRAVQTALRLFTNSENDLLVATYRREKRRSMISLACIDKRVSSCHWMLVDSPEFEAFRTWCALAGAVIQFPTSDQGDLAYDLIIYVDEVQTRHDTLHLIGQLTRVRLEELDEILALAQEEWAALINRDCQLFKHLAIEGERKRIIEHIHRLIFPHLQKMSELTKKCTVENLRSTIDDRIRSIVAGVNAVIAELHPGLLAESGLVPSIETLVDRFRRASLIEAQIVTSGSVDAVDIPPASKFAIYRVVQESLNNIEKHAGATCALINVAVKDDLLTILIEDNGTGLKNAIGSESLGLRYIKQRAQEIGADVAWSRSLYFGRGTKISITINQDRTRMGDWCV